jgi:hypothetical protein
MDVNVLAYRIVQKATEETLSPSAKATSSRKGGLKGGRARADTLSKERREEIAGKANMARWASRSAQSNS